jgi:hypothetical protein
VQAIPSARRADVDVLQLSAVPDQSDRMLLRKHFLDIESLICKQFSFDAFADDLGSNSQTPAFSSPSKSFFDTDVAGHTVWMNPPFNQESLSQSIQHYLNCKMSDPAHTSACILVPKWDGLFRKSLSSMTLIKEYPVGTVLFDQPKAGSVGGKRQVLPGIPWPVQVYYDAPRIQCSVSAADPACMLMSFNVKIAGAEAVALLDSGAQASFLSERFVLEHDMSTYACPVTQVRMADGSVTTVSRKCKAQVSMRNHASVVDAFILPAVVPGIDIIHGEDWLVQEQAALCYTARPHVRLTRGDGVFTIVKSRWDSCAPLPPALHTLSYVTDLVFAASTCEFLSAKQAQKLLDRGARHFLMLVKADDPDVSATRGGTMSSTEDGTPAMLVCATSSGDQAESGLVPAPVISELKSKYADIFQPLPQHLPPDRGVGHTSVD